MTLSLRVVVPPHPLIGHWLTLLRDQHTPAPLFGTAMAELGRWLTYEALRDWIPHQRVSVQTPLAVTEGTVVDGSVPLLAVPILRAGLGLWQGAQTVLPTATVAHMGLKRNEERGGARVYLDCLPEQIGDRVGVLVFDPMLATGGSLLEVLERLAARGVQGERLRVVTALAAGAGLKAVGERFPQLTVYTGCIDPDLDAGLRIVPGLGDAGDRLYGTSPAGQDESHPTA